MVKKFIWAFVALLTLYVILTFGLPPNPETVSRYQLSMTELRLLNLSIIIPIVAIYLTALYGFVRFYRYAKSVERSTEGPNFIRMATGLMVLTFGLPFNSVISSLTNYVGWRYPQLLTQMTLLRNYLTLLFAFASILLIAQGVRGLYATVSRKRSLSRLPDTYKILGPIILASVFTWLVMVRSGDSNLAYQLPDWLIVLTLVIPYVFVWCIGLRAAWELYAYQTTVKGIIYRRALLDVSRGIGAIIFVSIFIQFITTISERLSRLNVTPLLAIIYLLLIMYAVAFGFVARGAKKLKTIEEA